MWMVVKNKKDLGSQPWGSLSFCSPMVWLLIPVLGYIFVFFLCPLVMIFVTSVTKPQLGFGNYVRAFNTPVYMKVMLNTFQISLLITFLCLAMAYPLAYFMAGAKRIVRQILFLFVLLPFCSSILVRTYAWMALLQTKGVVNQLLEWIGLVTRPLQLMYNSIGLTIGMTHILLPFMILPLFGVMKGIDRHCVKVAKSLGASSFQAFVRVYFPRTVPGITAGCFLVFVQAIGYFITPALLGGRKETMIAMLIDTHINYLLNWGLGTTLSVILFIIVALVFSLYLRTPGLKKPWKVIS